MKALAFFILSFVLNFTARADDPKYCYSTIDPILKHYGFGTFDKQTIGTIKRPDRVQAIKGNTQFSKYGPRVVASISPKVTELVDGVGIALGESLITVVRFDENGNNQEDVRITLNDQCQVKPDSSIATHRDTQSTGEIRLSPQDCEAHDEIVNLALKLMDEGKEAAARRTTSGAKLCAVLKQNKLFAPPQPASAPAAAEPQTRPKGSGESHR